MTEFMEYRENIKNFYGKYEFYLLPVIKFLLSISIFLLINVRIGYMQRLHSMALVLALSLACALLPMMATLWSASILITLHCFALSLYVGVSVSVLFVAMYLLFFRFVPRSSYNVLLTPIAFLCGMPYAMPVANGLLEEPYAVISTICGVIAYYVLKGIHANETLLSEPVTKDALLDKFSTILNQVLGDKEMFLTIGIFFVVALIVFVIRRLSIDYAWTIAIVSGMIVQFLAFFMGYTFLDLADHTLELVIGSTVSTLILFLIQFFFFDLDYTRTERVQFEDDEYFYYVKAVPKRYVPAKEKMVVKIGGPAYIEDAEEGQEEGALTTENGEGK